MRWIKFNIPNILNCKKIFFILYSNKILYHVTYFNLSIYNLLNIFKKNIHAFQLIQRYLHTSYICSSLKALSSIAIMHVSIIRKIYIKLYILCVFMCHRMSNKRQMYRVSWCCQYNFGLKIIKEDFVA